jgi:uncharacterized membrane protein
MLNTALDPHCFYPHNLSNLMLKGLIMTTYHFKLFIAAVVFFFILDCVWLGLLSKHLYFQQLGGLLRKSGSSLNPNWGAAVNVYLLLAVGVVAFVLPKAGLSYPDAALWGALLGLVVYGVYDFTNYSILANWPLKITLIDWAWGTFLTGSVSVLTTCVKRYLTT